MSLFRSAATVGILTILSRICGFIRDILTASIIGAGPVADAFVIALKLPNFFRRITAEGAFSVSFVPVYSRELEKNGYEEAQIFAGRTLSMMLLYLIPFTLVMMLVMPWIIYGLAPGFEQGTARYDMALEMTRITFPYMVMMSVASLMGGVLNAHERFGPFAAAPILFNCSMIFMLLFYSDVMETPGHAMAWGVILAGIAQLIWLYGWLKYRHFTFRFQKPILTERMKRLFKLMGPGVMGAGIVQINLFVDMMIASFLPIGSVAFLYYADRVYQLPLSVIPTAIGTSILPRMTKYISAGEHVKSGFLFNRAMETSLLLGFPAALALVAIAHTVTEVLFERGEFTAVETVATAGALAAFALSIPAYSAAKVYATVCFANEDTLTPVKVSSIAALFNIVLSILFSFIWDHVGVALATSVSAWVQVALFSLWVHKKHDVWYDLHTIKHVPMIIGISAFMAFVVYLADDILIGWFGDDKLMHPFILVFLVGLGLSLYGTLVILLRIINIAEIKKLIRS